MSIFGFLNYQVSTAMKLLEQLIDSFDKLDNMKNIEAAMKIFDEVRSYIKVNENLLYPALIKADPTADRLLECPRCLHEQIEDTLEKSVMIHVDEPSNEFKENMILLLDLLRQDDDYHQNVLFPIACNMVPEETLKTMSELIEPQLTHESLLHAPDAGPVTSVPANRP